MAAATPLLLAALLVAVSLSAPQHAAAVTGKYFDRVYLIVLENTNYASARSNANYLNIESRGRLLTNYHATTHPSQPNYFAMVAGSDFGQLNDNTVTINAANLASRLEAAGVSWKVYSEGQGSACNLVSSATAAGGSTCGTTYSAGTYKGYYKRKHNPLISFTDNQSPLTRCQKITTETQFATDTTNNAVPQLVMYVPTQCNDGHDTSVTYSGAWLRWFFDNKLTGNAVSGPTLVVTVFDENEGTAGNQVWATMVAFNTDARSSVAPGQTSSTNLNHYGLLRAIEDNFFLAAVGRNDTTATAVPFA